MKRKVQWSESALNDIKNQLIYIARDNRTAAIRVADILRETGDGLAHFVSGRRSRGDLLEKVVPGLPYVIVYHLDQSESMQVITITRVYHAAQNRSGGKG